MRDVARRARVNSALVFHYFGSKDGLFRETLRTLVRPPDVDLRELTHVGGDVGTLIVRTFLDRWGGGTDSMAFQGLLRSATSRPRATEILRSVIIQQVTPFLPAGWSKHDSERRVALIASSLMGAGLVRFVVRLPGLVQPSADKVASWIGPTVTRYLNGDISQ